MMMSTRRNKRSPSEAELNDISRNKPAKRRRLSSNLSQSSQISNTSSNLSPEIQTTGTNMLHKINTQQSQSSPSNNDRTACHVVTRPIESNPTSTINNEFKEIEISQSQSPLQPKSKCSQTDHNCNEFENENKTESAKQERGEEDIDEYTFDEYDDDDAAFGEDGDDDNWGDTELTYDEQSNIKTYDPDKLDSTELLKRAMEKRRIKNADKSKFWKCGRTNCKFLNHPSRGTCMACNMPEMDIIRHCLNCAEPLKQCSKCSAYIIPKDHSDHELDCNPLGNDIKYKNNPKHIWYVKLTPAEKRGITTVTNDAFTKSEREQEKIKLLETIKKINIDNELLFGAEEEQEMIYEKLMQFLEWKVPIIIHVHCAKLVPLLLKDTHYRNLFETGYGSGNTDQGVRKREEAKLFNNVYFGCEGNERPKYGCLNVNLKEEGCKLAHQYGDGYFVMNNTTIRWRVTMTIKDSFAVNGVVGTLKHNKHLLNQLTTEELKQIIQVAIFGAHNDKDKQTAYREIQIHGPVQLDRDVYSFHVPDNVRNRAKEKEFNEFCEKNGIKLVWF